MSAAITNTKLSVCLYLKYHDTISMRNICYLSKYLENTKETAFFEVIVVYTENMDIACFTELYPNIRWYRILKKPMSYVFFYRDFIQKIRSKIFIFVSNQILLSIQDVFILANNALKTNVLVSYLEHSRYLFLPSHNKKLKDKFGYFLNRSRSELYLQLNAPLNASSIEFFAINLDTFQKALKKITPREKFYFFRGRFVMGSKKYKKESAYLDFCLPLMASRSNMQIHSPGKAQSRWLIPTSTNFFPLFMFYVQLKIILKLMMSTGYIVKIINYKRIFLLISHLALILFCVMTYLSYRDSWLLFAFFILLNIPLLLGSSRRPLSFHHILKIFLILL